MKPRKIIYPADHQNTLGFVVQLANGNQFVLDETPNGELIVQKGEMPQEEMQITLGNAHFIKIK